MPIKYSTVFNDRIRKFQYTVYVDPEKGDNTLENGFTSMDNALSWLIANQTNFGGTSVAVRQIVIGMSPNNGVLNIDSTVPFEIVVVGTGGDSCRFGLYATKDNSQVTIINCQVSQMYLSVSNFQGFTVYGNGSIEVITSLVAGGVTNTLYLTGQLTVNEVFLGGANGVAGDDGPGGNPAGPYAPTNGTDGNPGSEGQPGNSIVISNGAFIYGSCDVSGGFGGDGGNGGDGGSGGDGFAGANGGNGGDGANGGYGGNVTIGLGCWINNLNYSAGAGGNGGAGGGAGSDGGSGPGTAGSAGGSASAGANGNLTSTSFSYPT